MARFAVPLVLAVGCAVAALLMCVLFKHERAASRERGLTDRELYALGQATSQEGGRTRLSSLAALLREAGVEIAPGIWLSIAGGVAFVSLVGIVVVSSNLLAGLFVAVAVVAGAFMRLAALRQRRRALIDRQLVRVLPQLAAGVRSSLTLERALRAAAAHAPDPLGQELARVLAAASYGTTLAVAFEGFAKRTGSPVAKALAAALRMQQRFGGPAAPVLELIANHGSARLKASQELKTELAGTRLAKWFVAGSLPAIFLIMFATNSDFAQFYLHEPLGWAVMGFAAVSEAFGLVACHRITSCEGVDA